MADASPFLRHYLYDAAGTLTHTTALMRYKDWLRHADARRSPWGGSRDEPPVARVASEVERSLANSILVSRAYRQHRLPAGRWLRERPIADSEVHVLLDGLLLIEVDQRPALEVGPGAIFDPTLRTEESKAHVAVRALTDAALR